MKPKQLDRITFDRDTLRGKACIRGMHISAGMVVDLLAGGWSRERIVEEYPRLEDEDITQALRYAAWVADDQVSEANAETVWVFNGPKASFPSAVFHTKDEAVQWIKKYRLSGTLTAYPVGISVYDWAIKELKWKPKKPHESTPEFIARFSSASQEHFHFHDDDE